MDYRGHYERLVDLACCRVLTGYRERHHVLPRCLGGGDEPANIVELMPEEHYVAHQLLVKMHPGDGRLAYAAMRMAKQCVRASAFGWLRRRYAASMRGNKLNVGRRLTAEHRAKIAASSRSTQFRPGHQTFKGRRHSAEARAKMSVASRGRPKSAEHVAKTAAAKRGQRHSDETRAKMSAAHKGNKYNLGRTPSPATRAKLSAAIRAVWAQRKAAQVGA